MDKNRLIPYQLDALSVIKLFKSSESGLKESSAQKRLESYGFNVIEDVSKSNPLKKILEQFKSPMMIILVVAFFISLGLKENIDAWVIFSVIIVNTAVGFIHEYRVERSVAALKKVSTPFAKVYRDGVVKKIKTSMIVPGDVIEIEEGDRIPADGRIIDARNLKTIESALTGESSSVTKNTIKLSIKLPVADRKNMVWMGTFVTSGAGKFVVTETGNGTAFGRIAKSIGSIKKDTSLFTKKIGILSRQAGIVAGSLAGLIFILAFFVYKLSFKETFLFSMASLVSIIPEGMLALFSIILAIGARRMANKKALIKGLPEVEGIGSITTIITDKTGTLTQNIMMAEVIETASGERFGISGSGWDPVGLFLKNSKIVAPKDIPDLSKALKIMAVCNNSKIRKTENKDFEIIGEPTEAALLVAAEKGGFKQADVLEEEYVIDAPPFDSNKKYRETLVEHKNGERYVYIVGAPENVLNKCSNHLKDGRSYKLSKEHKESIKESFKNIASEGLRTLSVAYRKVDKRTYKVDDGDIKSMVYVGVIGLKDPLRDGVKVAIQKAREAGIKVVMATGDHKITASAIAKEIGLDYKNAVSEEELVELTEKEFESVVLNTNVFARVSPQTKLKIAEILQKNGEIVAMTGDGVNDAPALKKANVGIAMGKIGTDVAREAAQIVLTDDNFNTIIDSIEEGRLVFRNVQKTGTFLLSTNLAEGATILSTMAIGLPLPLLPTQILWLNLITDSLAGFPLAGELAHQNNLKDHPKTFQENILSKRTVPFMVLMVLVMVIGAIIIFKSGLVESTEKARTLVFLFIAFTQLFNVLNLRSLNKSIFKIKAFSNKYLIFGLGAAILANILVIYNESLREIFKLEKLSGQEFIMIIIYSLSVIIFAELYKVFKNRFGIKNNLV